MKLDFNQILWKVNYFGKID